MTWTLSYLPEAEAAMDRLELNHRIRIRKAVVRIAEGLSHNPPQILGDLKRLQGDSDAWRLRVADWRAILRLDQGRCVVMVVTVGHRSKVYKDRS